MSPPPGPASPDGGAAADGDDLSPEARRRLADIVELQPTKNAELGDRWGMESGSEVHGYLESELRDYYYRDEDSRIRATAAAVALVGGDPAALSVSRLEARLVETLAGPDERSESVVSALHGLRAAYDYPEGEPTADAVRRALQSLRRKGAVEAVYRTVPTFRLAAPRDEFTLEVSGDVDPEPADDGEMSAIEQVQAEFEER